MQQTQSQVLVLGGYGAVGLHIMNELDARGIGAHSAGRDASRADRAVDIRNPSNIATIAGEYATIINATGAEDPRLAAAATARGATWIDITATNAYIKQLAAIPSPAAAIIVSVGIAPGLTNLLAHEAQTLLNTTNRQRPDQRQVEVSHLNATQLSVGVLLGAGEAHGAAASAWSFGLLGKRFQDPTSGRRIRNYTAPRTFDIAGTPRRLYRTDFSDQHALTPQLSRPVATYFGTDTRLATGLLAAATWLPGASRMPSSTHLPGTDTWILTIEDSNGPIISATGQSQSLATGIVAARAVEASIGAPSGLQHLTDLTTLGDLDLPFHITTHR